MQALLPRFDAAKLNLIEAAEAMPEASYDFKLTPGQRTFGDWIEHNISMNFSMCASMVGHTTPREHQPGGKGKAELVRALKESFDYCEPIFKSMTDEKSQQHIQINDKLVYPVAVMIALVSNWNEHYGNMVGYLRTKGITPPSTARVPQK